METMAGARKHSSGPFNVTSRASTLCVFPIKMLAAVDWLLIENSCLSYILQFALKYKRILNKQMVRLDTEQYINKN